MTRRGLRSCGPRVLRWIRVGPRGWSKRLLLLAALIGAITVVASAAIYVARTYHQKVLWRNDVYAKLTSLKAGFDLAYFKEVLGPPVFSRSRKTGFTESTFQGHGFWVQALSNRKIVKLYAITACEDAFQPTFTIPGLGYKVTLNKSSFADVLRLDNERSGNAIFDYRFSGALISSYFYEAVAGGDPAYDKDYFWGISDACPDWGKGPTERLAVQLAGFPGCRGRTTKRDPLLQKFRRVATVNTYAETAPGRSVLPLWAHPNRTRGFGHLYGFTLGVDRFLVRTTE